MYSFHDHKKTILLIVILISVHQTTMKRTIKDFFQPGPAKQIRQDQQACVQKTPDPELEQPEGCVSTTPTGADRHETSQGSSTTEWPECWSKEKADYFSATYNWLCWKNGKLGCKVCQDASKDKVNFSAKAVALIDNWCTVEIAAYGENHENKLRSLRKKIHQHKSSQAHETAEKIAKSNNDTKIPAILNKVSNAEAQSTCHIFRTAYYIVKQERPFSDFPSLMELQKLNGADMGSVLHSRKSAADICEYIGTKMREKLVKVIKESEVKISVMIDEATTKSNTTALVVCLRCFLDDTPTSLFLDLLEIRSGNSESIVTSLLESLQKHGFSEAYLQDHLVCFACDGASAMLGRTAGVAATLKKKFPNLITWHCSNHRLELAVHDCVNAINEVNHFKIFLDKLYSTYSASPKNRGELEAVASSLSTELQRIGRVLDTRWSASSYRTVQAVLTCYPALAEHLRQASQDTSRDQKERSKYKGMHNYVTSKNFVANLLLMADALQELSELSLSLQSRGITMVQAHQKIKLAINVMETRKEKAGPHSTKSAEELSHGKYKDVNLSTSARTLPLIKPAQLYQSLVDNLNSRMLTTASRSRSLPAIVKQNVGEYKQLLNDLQVLEPSSWPAEPSCCYGEEAIERLCIRMKLPLRPAIQGFREFLFEGGKSKTKPEGIQKLLKTTESLIVSTAECERSFSVMNDIISDTRNRLGIQRASALMFVKIVGPPLSKFLPEPYVKTWLSSGRRSADHAKCMKVKPTDATEHPYAHLSSLFETLH